MYSVKIDGKDYPISLRFGAVREYKKLTGRNLLDGSEITHIFGGKDNTLDPELFLSFVQSCLFDAGEKQEAEALANAIRLTDIDTITSLSRMYVHYSTGKGEKEIDDFFEALKKNQIAP
jgi:hypothetical protein